SLFSSCSLTPPHHSTIFPYTTLFRSHPAHLPIIEFPAGTLPFTLVKGHPNICLHQVRLQFARGFENRFLLFVRLEDGNNHGLVRRELWRHHQSLIIAVHHNDRAHHARRKPP